jgi:hypothetical protein
MAPYPNEDDVEEVEDIGLEPTTGSGEEQKPISTRVGVGGYNVDIDNRALPYVGIVVSAIVLLISITVPSGKNQNQGYGLSVCIISMILGLFGAFMVTMKTEWYDNPLTKIPMVGDVTWGTGLAQFIFLWNLIGAGVLTFDGPFVITSNGYFACWAGVIFAVMAVGVTTDVVRSHAGNFTTVNGLLVASIIQICAVIPEMDGAYKGPSTYSLVISILTIMAILAFGAYPTTEKLKFPFFALFSIFWIVLACFVTFKGPFLATGNGYFTAWMGCVLCVIAAASSVPQS